MEKCEHNFLAIGVITQRIGPNIYFLNQFAEATLYL